jgi:hypothetical protein
MASLSTVVSYACQATQGIITLTSLSDAPGAAPGASYTWIVRAGTGTDYGGPVAAGDSVAVPDGSYLVRVFASYSDNTTASGIPHTVEVNCAGNTGSSSGPTCDLVASAPVPTDPTTIGGFGYVTFNFTTADQGTIGVNAVGPVAQAQNFQASAGTAQLNNLPAGTYNWVIALTSDATCARSGTFTINDPAPPADPSLNDPARWEPVGGVLPNPVLLKVEASLTNAQGAARAGLHVEVELWRPAAAAAFVSFRATVRTATQYVDAAPYLREQLVALQRYAATASRPLIDQDASLRFYYRYRVVDKTGPEQWLTRDGERYAVLAALPEAADTMLPYVADTVGRVASVFSDYEGAQFVGLPLECTVLLPPPTPSQDRWAELRYLDAYKQEVEIRSFALAATLPAGVLRMPLPGDVLPCAAYVEVSVRDDNRAYVGTCGAGTPVQPFPTPGNLIVNGGYLKL